jgi:hypothetical protein
MNEGKARKKDEGRKEERRTELVSSIVALHSSSVLLFSTFLSSQSTNFSLLPCIL